MDLDAINSPWAVREDLLPAIAGILTGKSAGLEQLLGEVPEPEAAALNRGGMLQNSVAVIPLSGMITPKASFLSMLFGGGGGLGVFRAQLREAVSNDEVGSILINVDSPGGRLDLLPETAAEIRAAGEEKPVVAVANTMAASAAYWLASQANELVITPSGQVGSVGVYCMHIDWSKWNGEFGIDVTYVAAGRYKTELNPDEPLSDEALAYLQARVDEGRDQFAADVAKGRKVSAATVKGEQFGEGRMLKAKDAVKAGMADRVEPLEAAIARLARGGRRSSAGGRRAEGLQFTDHIASVVAEVDAVIDRAADVVAKRAEKGKGLGSESADLLAELGARLDRVRGISPPGPGNDDNEATTAAARQEFLRSVRDRVA
ncbi:MAG TPA: S49 family peptidase [Solirubrobacterales bacterium]|nr:S49 family peptidase [Solirubrobacterales bacterium]